MFVLEFPTDQEQKEKKKHEKTERFSIRLRVVRVLRSFRNSTVNNNTYTWYVELDGIKIFKKI